MNDMPPLCIAAAAAFFLAALALLVYEEQRRVNGRRQDVIFRFEMGREL